MLHDMSDKNIRKLMSITHRCIQGAFFIFMVVVGLQFVLFACWAMQWSDFFVARPPVVEAFLPISALLALKRFILTGSYDAIHPAGLTILLMALFMALIARKGFCGYVCPFGTVSLYLFRLGKQWHIHLHAPRWLAFIQACPKYVLLLFFVYITLVSLNVNEIEAFLYSRYNMVADTKMLLFFLPPGIITLAVLILLFCGSLVIPSFWCRCFCPYGALLGIFSLCSPLAVRRKPTLCIGCEKCSRACPMGIDVQHKERINSSLCTGCLACVSACPQKGCLGLYVGYTARHSRPIAWWYMPLLVVAIVACLYGIAVYSSAWHTSIPQEMWRTLHEGIGSLQHY